MAVDLKPSELTSGNCNWTFNHNACTSYGHLLMELKEGWGFTILKKFICEKRVYTDITELEEKTSM